MMRILLNIQGYGHGGADLLTSGKNNSGLRIKHQFNYTRLRDALRRVSVETVQRCDASDDIHSILEANVETMPVLLHLNESVASSEEADTEDEITGCVRFI